MEKILATYAAGEIKTFEITGNYFELVQAKAPVDIYLQDRNGTNLALLKAAEASYYMKLYPAQYQRIQVKSDTAQDVAFIRADGECGTRNMAGIIRVVDEDTAGAYSKKSFICTARDSADVAEKRFLRTAICNESDDDLVVNRISLNVSINGDSSAVIISGLITAHIAPIDVSKFSRSYGFLTNGLKLTADFYSSTKCLESAESPFAQTMMGLPMGLGQTVFDLEKAPIIVGAGKMLVITKRVEDMSISDGSVVGMRTLFQGKKNKKDIIEV